MQCKNYESNCKDKSGYTEEGFAKCLNPIKLRPEKKTQDYSRIKQKVKNKRRR